MKNLLIFITLITLVSCTDPTKENSLEDFSYTKHTEIINLTKDTVIIANDDNAFYHFNDEGDVMLETCVTTSNVTNPIPVGDLLLMLFLSFIVGMSIGVSIN